MTTLSTLCNKLEPTDELILLNKHYQNLDIIYDKIEELRDLIADLHELNLECANGEIKMLAKKQKFLDREAAVRALDIMQQSVMFEHSHTRHKSREIFTFQKLGKAISLYKSVK